MYAAGQTGNLHTRWQTLCSLTHNVGATPSVAELLDWAMQHETERCNIHMQPNNDECGGDANPGALFQTPRQGRAAPTAWMGVLSTGKEASTELHTPTTSINSDAANRSQPRRYTR